MKVKANFLKRCEVEKIHEASLYVLSKAGVKFQNEYAREVFQKHGAKVVENKVFISESLLNQALYSIPKSFVLYGREQGNNVTIGQGNPVLASASGPVYVRKGQVKYLAQDEDFINFIKLSETSEVLNVTNYIMVEPQDVMPEKRKLHQVAACLKFSAKPLIGITMGEGVTRQAFDLVKRFYGEWSENRLLGIISPISPLVYDQHMINHIIDYAKEDQPILIASCSLPGATSPVSVAGTLVIDNAEVLAGIVLSQLIKPGLPVIYGNTSTACDLRYAAPAIGSPETALVTMAVAELSDFYGIPCRSGGCLTDAKTADVQAGLESMMTIMPSFMCGVDFILQSCGILESFNTLSYEKFIIDEQILDMVKRLTQGFEINDHLLGLEVIEKLGPGANFMDNQHTADYFRQEQYIPKLLSREGFTQWQNNGSLTLEEKAGQIWEKRISEYRAPDISKEQLTLLEEYL